MVRQETQLERVVRQVRQQKKRYALYALGAIFAIYLIYKMFQPAQPRGNGVNVAKHDLSLTHDFECSNFFIDIGSGEGNSINEFSGKGNGKISDARNEILSSNGMKVSDFCVMSFEGNPEYTSVLSALQKELEPTFMAMRTFTETVVSDEMKEKTEFCIFEGKGLIEAQIENGSVCEKKVNVTHFLLMKGRSILSSTPLILRKCLGRLVGQMFFF